MRGALSSASRPKVVLRGVGSTSCSRCGLQIDAQAWRALRLVDRVAPERVRELVTHWPSGARIEVRRCSCGRALARMSTGPRFAEPDDFETDGEGSSQAEGARPPPRDE